jgi:small subunit ribosomal protein S8
MVNDPIADMLVRIQNAQKVRHDRVSMPSSKVVSKIASILKDAGYIGEIDRKKKKAKKTEFDYLDLELKYKEGNPAISGLKLISRPSRHIYIKASEIKPVRSGYGMAVISTSKGIMSSQEARKQKLGGEMLFEIW